MPRCSAFLNLLLLALGVMDHPAQGAPVFSETPTLDEPALVTPSPVVEGNLIGLGADKNLAAEENESGENSAARDNANQEAKEDGEDSAAENDESSDAEKTDEKKTGEENTDEDNTDEEKTDEENTDGQEKDADNKKEKDKSSKKKEPEKPKPFEVKGKSMKIEVKLDGAFVADQMEEVSLRPEVWTKFKVLEAVEHGAAVKKSDVLIRFDPEDLEKELAQESINQRLSELALLQAEEEFPRLKELAEVAFQGAQRRNLRLKEDHEYYQETDRPFDIAIAHYRYKDAQEDLASQREELEQLQKMYEADELTEETEEIVLRRQRFQVKTAELIMELSTAGRDYALNVLIPRRDETYLTRLKEDNLSFDQAKTARDMGRTRRVYEMEKLRQSRARSVERHAKLLSDKGLMALRAPTDGIVYFGRCLAGKWPEIATQRAKLKPLGSATAKSVLMTIVKQRPLYVESSFGEKDLPELAAGLPVAIVPVADDNLEWSGKVTEMETVPNKSNKFKIRMEMDNAAIPDWLVAGMTCKTKITTYHNKNALQIPAELVQTDEENEKVKYVMFVDPDQDEPVRRDVKLGHKQGKMVEVLKGLAEGDEVIKEEKKDSTTS